MKKNRESIIVISLGVILVIVVIAISVIVTQSNTPEQNKPKLQPTIQKPTLIPVTPATNSSVKYDQDAQEKLMLRKINRRKLSTDDAAIKARMLKLIPAGKLSGVIYAEQDFNVEYLQPLDLVKVEILTTDIPGAKSKANVWFRNQGMSQKGICELPLEFYLNWDIAQKLRNSNTIFSPLSNGC
jgi:hypothetical protein